ncbi:hypothetical protein SAMN06297144_1277 [Sphingomonas guangdongensis]|uniref:Uncharacterized protein n=1 Tax=Sphingomonas guangdongensis TaxID=1141890 RepID=A0A285QL57_9SPHN|nr:hypothetical protein [Sphingomonas guangdongensis]SOB80867.1 hypothetical protein SAMN06297144_1277 [Sphingomonas guangdongensis]
MSWILATLLLAAPLPVQAAGQPLAAAEAEAELAVYADCVVAKKAHRAAVAAFLRTLPDSAGFYTASMKAADMTCLNEVAVRRRAAKLEMRLQPASFRDALYPALYRRAFARRGAPAGVAGLSPLDLGREFDGDSAQLSTQYRAQRALGDCVARQAPAAAHALLLSVPRSAEERAATIQLTPAIGGCVADGRTVQLNRSDLRAAVGEALYKLAVQAGGTPAA